MASPAAAEPGVTPARPSLPIRRGWKGWALIGACFALGYGVSQRLVSIRLEGGLGGSQRFEVKSFPGTELDSLRRRFGEASMQIRGDLDLEELERQRRKEAASIEQRRVEMEQREQEPSPADAASPSPAADATGAPEPLPEAPVLPPPSEPEPAAPPNPPAAPVSPGTTP